MDLSAVPTMSCSTRYGVLFTRCRKCLDIVDRPKRTFGRPLRLETRPKSSGASPKRCGKPAKIRYPHLTLTSLLRLFTKGARIIEFEKLREVVGDFQQLEYAKGAVELPLTCAQVQDPDGAGLECWHAGMTPSDPRYELMQTRLNCYDLVLDSLRVFEEKCKDKLTMAPTTGVAALDDPESVRSHAYELAFASDDEMFHSTLYDWLISRDLADDLLEVRRLAFELIMTFDTSFLDEATILGGIPSTRTCNRAKIPTFMAILR